MNKLFRILYLFVLLVGLSSPLHAQQLSDDQVIALVKEQKTAGKSDQEIGRLLVSRGVTREQLQRIKENYEKGQQSREDDPTPRTESRLRERRLVQNFMTTAATDSSAAWQEIYTGEATAGGGEQLPPERRIYGHDLFTGRQLTFEPNENMATPQNYRLGPGDEVIVDIWGANETSLREEITPEGNIMVSQIGPVYLNGLTIAEADRKIREVLSRKYAGVSGDNPSSQVRVTLGQIRTIQVNVMGEVAVPGTYRLSSFATVFHALYRAGGVSEIGSLRDIRVVRGGREAAVVDVYSYLMKGAAGDDIRLEDGDVVLVPPYGELVQVQGRVKRPMFYEMKSGEPLSALIGYAGGFAGDAYTKEVTVVRRSGRENSLYSVQEPSYASWRLADGDSVSVGAVLDRFANRVEIEGAVYRPGMYELGGPLTTVKELVTRAEGLTGDAFLARAILTREKEDLTHEVIAVDLEGVLSGRLPDIPLRREDVLSIPSVRELQAQGAFTVDGEVNRPGIYPYAENTTLEDLLVQAGGLLESASTVRVDISRRIRDAKSLYPGSETAEVFTFAVKDGYVIDGTPGFVLEPYDVVEVRRSPGYQVQRRVSIGGEAVFAGGYTLTKKNERLSDLVSRAGGLTAEAYVRGGRLIRRMNEEERAQRQAALDMAVMNAGSDSVSVAKLRLSDTYTVGIELDKALANPGSDYDVVLREGDYLYIPEYVSTVKITGEVQFPNTVTYIAGKSKSYYINQAGGYGKMAKKRSAYVVHMNGTVTRIKRLKSGQIEPGCQIIVPSKKERKGMSIAEIVSLTTSAASIGTMAATIANLAK